jgi:hypothetical protein
MADDDQVEEEEVCGKSIIHSQLIQGYWLNTTRSQSHFWTHQTLQNGLETFIWRNSHKLSQMI